MKNSFSNKEDKFSTTAGDSGVNAKGAGRKRGRQLSAAEGGCPFRGSPLYAGNTMIIEAYKYEITDCPFISAQSCIFQPFYAIGRSRRGVLLCRAWCSFFFFSFGEGSVSVASIKMAVEATQTRHRHKATLPRECRHLFASPTKCSRLRVSLGLLRLVKKRCVPLMLLLRSFVYSSTHFVCCF